MWIKQLLVGVVTIAVSSFAVAGGPVVKGYPGYQDNFRKRPAPVDSSSSRVQRVETGFYLGVRAGITRISEGDGLKDFTEAKAAEFGGTTNLSRDVFGGSGFLGYNFNKYLGLEVSYFEFPSNHYDVNAILNSYTSTYDTYAIAAMGKLYFPVGNWLPFLQAGVAFEQAKLSGAQLISINSDGRSNSGTRPIYGLGIGYRVTPHFTAAVSWMEIYGSDKMSYENGRIINFDKALPTVDYLSFEISYRFPELF